jgi:hypothetical protein
MNFECKLALRSLNKLVKKEEEKVTERGENEEMRGVW